MKDWLLDRILLGLAVVIASIVGAGIGLVLVRLVP